MDNRANNTREQIRRAFRAKRTVQEVADMTGFSDATVASHVRSLVGDGLVNKVGVAKVPEGQRGRASAIYKIAA